MVNISEIGGRIMKMVNEKQYLDLLLKYEMRIIKVYEDKVLVRFVNKISF